MRVLTDPWRGQSRPQTLLVLLPPAEAALEDFHAHGFVSAVRDRGLAVDIQLAEVTYQHLMAKTVVPLLHAHVVRPALAAGFRHIWMAGISLGAFNALHYAAAHAAHLSGLHLIAPYPGTGDVLAEIAAAGGPAVWAGVKADDRRDERAWWHWLCRGRQDANTPMRGAAGALPVYMGTGRDDRFLRGQRMLAGLLPAARVRYLPGTHGWPTWQALWHDWLDNGPLARRQPHTAWGGHP